MPPKKTAEKVRRPTKLTKPQPLQRTVASSSKASSSQSSSSKPAEDPAPPPRQSPSGREVSAHLQFASRIPQPPISPTIPRTNRFGISSRPCPSSGIPLPGPRRVSRGASEEAPVFSFVPGQPFASRIQTPPERLESLREARKRVPATFVPGTPFKSRITTPISTMTMSSAAGGRAEEKRPAGQGEILGMATGEKNALGFAPVPANSEGFALVPINNEEAAASGPRASTSAQGAFTGGARRLSSFAKPSFPRSESLEERRLALKPEIAAPDIASTEIDAHGPVEVVNAETAEAEPVGAEPVGVESVGVKTAITEPTAVDSPAVEPVEVAQPDSTNSASVQTYIEEPVAAATPGRAEEPESEAVQLPTPAQMISEECHAEFVSEPLTNDQAAIAHASTAEENNVTNPNQGIAEPQDIETGTVDEPIGETATLEPANLETAPAIDSLAVEPVPVAQPDATIEAQVQPHIEDLVAAATPDAEDEPEPVQTSTLAVAAAATDEENTEQQGVEAPLESTSLTVEGSIDVIAVAVTNEQISEPQDVETSIQKDSATVEGAVVSTSPNGSIFASRPATPPAAAPSAAAPSAAAPSAGAPSAAPSPDAPSFATPSPATPSPATPRTPATLQNWGGRDMAGRSVSSAETYGKAEPRVPMKSTGRVSSMVAKFEGMASSQNTPE